MGKNSKQMVRPSPWRAAASAELCASEKPDCRGCCYTNPDGTCRCDKLLQDLAFYARAAYCDERNIGKAYMQRTTGMVYRVVRVTADFDNYVMVSGNTTIFVTPKELRERFYVMWREKR